MQDEFSFDGFPCWLEDETLFSLVSRYHRLTGHSSPKHTAQILFGSAMSGYQHDLPSGIDHFVETTRRQRGTSTDVIHRRTILPFFLAFRSRRDERNAHAAMRGPRIGSLKYQLGLLTSRFRAHHPLRACRMCMTEDVEVLGTAYWHRIHQFPGVLICIRHRSPLLVSNIKSTGVRRFDYLLPDSDELEPHHCIDHDIDDKRIMALTRLAVCAKAVGNLERTRILEPEFFQETCANRLHQLGLLTETGRLRLTQAAESYSTFLQPLMGIDDLSGLPQSLDEARRELGRMIRGSRGGTHTLRYVAIVLWLFDDWPSFAKELFSPRTKQYSGNPAFDLKSEVRSASDQRRKECLRLINNEGLSVTRAARHIGVDVATAIGWAIETGAKTTRRSKRVLGPLLADIVNDIKRGDDRAMIASSHDVSVSTVARVIYATPGLMAVWKRSRFALRLKAKRDEWASLVASHGQMGRKLLRSMLPKTYAWLYRHDLAWLRRSLRRLPKVEMGNNASIDWVKRDSDLSNQVAKTALALREDPTASKITLGRLCQLIPALKPRLSQLGRLPMTRRALNIAIKNKEQPQDHDSIPFDE